jgi:hypothetical protein
MTKQAQIDRVLNEGGEGYSLAADQADQAAMTAYQAAKAAFAAEWTLEVLAARRAAWNAEMQALIDAGKQLGPATVQPIIKKLGYSLTDIKTAKALHGQA